MVLKQLVTLLIHPHPPRARVSEFVRVCQKISAIHLRHRIIAGRLNPDLVRLSIQDTALDCIAELFQYDEKGYLIQLRTYFERIHLEDLSEEDVLTHVRRLVFSKTNQGLFRIYNEADPSLGKILRNIKLALQSLHGFTVTDRFGEQSLAPALCESLEHLPAFDLDELKQAMHGEFKAGETVPSFLSKLSVFLQSQTTQSRIIPLMLVASLIRSLYASDYLPEDARKGLEEGIIVEEAHFVIASVCRSVMIENTAQYVGNKNLSPEVYRAYFEVIEGKLIARLIGRDGEGYSLFEGLRELLPGLTNEVYRERDRSKIEYLLRLTSEKALSELRKSL